jgi:hypothetical protein
MHTVTLTSEEYVLLRDIISDHILEMEDVIEDTNDNEILVKQLVVEREILNKLS